MFKITKEPIFRRKLTVHVPDGEKIHREAFEVSYRVVPVERAREVLESEGDGVAALLREVIVEIHDIADENGEPLEYNDVVRDRIINLPYGRSALLDGYNQGVGGARKGN